ncbi:MAG: hypothetical protein KKC11_05935 [Candidatus Omnitrophica bacterium]|nr:hypothetical protein [Candidatus Omnitrophota bacterium]
MGTQKWSILDAYVDTGAFYSIFCIQDAEFLGINYQKGKQSFATVGDGSLIPVYFHNLPIKIGNISFKATLGFSPRLGVGFNLLGRKDIFERFVVIFDDVKKVVTFLPRKHWKIYRRQFLEEVE